MFCLLTMMRMSLNLMLLIIKPEEVWLGNKWLLGKDHKKAREDQDRLMVTDIEYLAKNLENLYIFHSVRSKTDITAKDLIHSLELPSYPNTDRQGVGYIINATGKTQEKIKEEIDTVQWSRSLDNSTRGWTELESIFFDNRPCIRRRWKCSGIKRCPYLHPDIANMQVTTVDESTFQLGQQIRQNIDANNIQVRMAR